MSGGGIIPASTQPTIGYVRAILLALSWLGGSLSDMFSYIALLFLELYDTVYHGCVPFFDSDLGAGLRIGVGNGTTVSILSVVTRYPAQNTKTLITNCAFLQPILLYPMPSYSLEVDNLFSDSRTRGGIIHSLRIRGGSARLRGIFGFTPAFLMVKLGLPIWRRASRSWVKHVRRVIRQILQRGSCMFVAHHTTSIPTTSVIHSILLILLISFLCCCMFSLNVLRSVFPVEARCRCPLTWW